MGKFVARMFVPGTVPNDGMYERCPDDYAFDFAWEAWESLLNERLDAESYASGVFSSAYEFKLYSAAGDMNELAEPKAYDAGGLFQVASVGHDWFKSPGVGVIWAPTPVGVNSVYSKADKGICYQVSWEETYVGL